jgi:hypothetical protein
MYQRLDRVLLSTGYTRRELHISIVLAEKSYVKIHVQTERMASISIERARHNFTLA